MRDDPSPSSAEQIAQEDPLEFTHDGMETAVIPVVEEKLVVGKREVVTDKVCIQTVTDMVEQLIQNDLTNEKIEVTHVPVNRYVEHGTAPPDVRTEGDLTIVPVLEEVLVVEKRILIREELHIKKTAATETVEVPVTLRKQRAVIERLNSEGEVITETMEKKS